jgi:group I intron endonuclease
MAYGAVYLVTNTASGKRYVGQTTMPVATRWTAHVANAKKAGCPALSRAIRKYGAAAFRVESLGECGSRAELDASERFAIEWLGSLTPLGYNLTTGGRAGGRQADEVCARKSAAHRRRYEDPAQRERQGANSRKVWARPDVRAKRSASAAAHWTAERRAEWSQRWGAVAAERIRAAQPKGRARARIPIAVIAADGTRQEFGSCQEACVALGLEASAVSVCLRGGRSQHKGYRFERLSRET